MKTPVRFGAVALATVMTACGGGGGGGGGGNNGGGTNQAPTARFLPSDACGGRVEFDANPASDSDGSIAAYAWNFGDGNSAQGASVTHDFAAAGSYGVTLTVTDDDGATASTTETVTINPGTLGLTLACGTIVAPINQVVDSDVNDPAMPFTANDDLASAQALPNPARVGGYLNLPNAGPAGRSFGSGDAADFYRVEAFGGETVNLAIQNNVLDANTFTLFYADLSLTLYDQAQTVIDQSVGTGPYRSLSIPAAGTYTIEVSIESTPAPDGSTLASSLYGLTVSDDTALLAKPAQGRAFRLSADFVPGDVVVAYRDPQNRRAVATADDTTSLARVGGDGAELRRLAPAQSPRRQVASADGAPTDRPYASDLLRRKAATLRVVKDLLRRPDVRYAEPNYLRYSARVPNDQNYPAQSWFFEAVRMPQAWDITTGSNDVIVAILDSGTVLDHGELDARAVPGYDFVGLVSNAGQAVIGGSADGDAYDADPTEPPLSAGCANPDPYHGVQVAGLVAAETNEGFGTAGSTWAGRFMPLRVIGDCGGFRVAADVAGGGGATFDIAEAILFAAGRPNAANALPASPADIINMSFSSVSGNEFSQREQDAINTARSANVVVVASAGNNASATPRYPSNYQGVIGVGATTNGNQLSPFSNTGAHIDITAPGGDNSATTPAGLICTTHWRPDLSPREQAVCGWGTSLAAPIVSGTIALMKAVNPALTPADVDNLLAAGQMTDDLGPAGRDNSFGWGLLNAEKAVLAAQSLAGSAVTASPDNLDFGTTETELGFTLTSNSPFGVTNVALGDDALELIEEVPAGNYTLRLDRTALAPGASGNGFVTLTFDSGAPLSIAYAYSQPETLAEPPADLASTPATALAGLDFGYGAAQIGFSLRDEGGGAIALASASAADDYLRLIGPGSGDGLGLYRVSLDRSGLAPGDYSSSIRFALAGGGVFEVPVSFRVLAPERVQPGDAGILTLQVFDANAVGTSPLLATETLRPDADGRYDYAVPVSAGSLLIWATTDLDNQGVGFGLFSPGPVAFLTKCGQLGCQIGEATAILGTDGPASERPEPTAFEYADGDVRLGLDFPAPFLFDTAAGAR